MTEFVSTLLTEAAAYCPVSQPEAELMDAHYQLLLRWNKVLNLTRITDVHAAVRRHYLESIFLASVLPAGEFRVVDVGSGGGFPGIPLGILRPEVHVTLVEAHQRKAVFLREAIRGFPNFGVVGARAETLATLSFDWMVSRAVRWEEVLPSCLAPKVALLMSADAVPVSPGWAWENPVVLPWDPGSVIRIARSID